MQGKVFGLIAAFFLLISAAQAQKSAEPRPDADYLDLAARSFDKQDIDRDGYLTRGLLVQEATAEQIAAQDTDGDGRISKQEWLDYARKHRPQ